MAQGGGHRLVSLTRDAVCADLNRQARYAWASSAGLSLEVEGWGSRGTSRESACEDRMSGRGKLRCIAPPLVKLLTREGGRGSSARRGERRSRADMVTKQHGTA